MSAKTYGYILIILIMGIIVWNIISWFSGRDGRPRPVNLGGGASEQILSETRLFFPGLIDNGKIVLGLVDLGRYFVRIDRTTHQTTRLMNEAIPYAPDEVSYAPDGSAVIFHQSGSPGRTTLVNFATKTFQELNPGISQVVWLPDSKAIVYIFQEQPQKPIALVRARPDATEFEILIENLAVSHPRLSLSPDGTKLAITSTYQGEDLTNLINWPLMIFNLQTKTLTQLPQNGAIAPIWSPDGRRLAYLRLKPEDQLGYIAILDLTDGTEHVSTVPTLPGKFTWRTNDELVAASPNPSDPEDLASGISLASNDQLWRITSNGQTIKLTGIAESSPLKDLMIADEGTTLVFRRLEILVQAPLPKE